MKKIGIFLLFLLFLIIWSDIILFLTSSNPEYPILRARLGTILLHTSDKNGRTGEAMYDPEAVAHAYCYYPKAEAQSKVILKRQDNGDCNKWYGQVIFHEGSWVSEKEKFWWSREQHLQDCGKCDDLYEKPAGVNLFHPKGGSR